MASETAGRTGRPARNNNWQDWASLILALWLFVSPWVLGFGGTVRTPAGALIDGGVPAAAAADAAWNAWVAGGVVFLTALSAIGEVQLWQEWLTLAVALWIFVSPWVVGFAALAPAAWEHWIVGALVFLSSLSLILAARRGRLP